MMKSLLVFVFLAAAASAAVMSPLQKAREALLDSAGIVGVADDVTDDGGSSPSDSTWDGSTREPTGTWSDEPTNPNNSTTPDPTIGTTTEEPEIPGGDDGLTDGEIAGIVIGSLAGVALIGGGIYYLYYKKMLCFENM